MESESNPGVLALLFAIALVLSDAFNVMARGGFIAKGWVDDAGDDPLKIHREPVPTSGGVAVFGAWLLACFATVPFVDECQWSNLAVLAIPGGALAWLGFRDDRVGLSPRTRLVVQVGVAILWVLAVSPWVAVVASMFMVFFIVGGVNAMNMQDGRDGLAGGVAMISLLGSGLICFTDYYPHEEQGIYAFIGAAACLGFLQHNRPPAKVYLGDSGAYFLGFLVAAVPARIFQQSVLDGKWLSAVGAVLLVGLPVLDAAVAIVRRRLRGAPMFSGDRDHLYDVLARQGRGPWAVAWITWWAHATLVLSGLLLIGRRL